MVPDGQNPQAFNRYAYGLNNPVKYLDPSGHYVYEGGSCAIGSDDCDPTASSYTGRFRTKFIGYDERIYDYGVPVTIQTRIVPPAESARRYGVAVAQRLPLATIVDPDNVGFYYSVMGWGAMGMGGARMPESRPLVPGPYESFMNPADAIGNPDCVGCGYQRPPAVAGLRGLNLPFEDPGLSDQIETVVDSMDNTGMPPAGVRQGGALDVDGNWRQGLFQNRQGALPIQPEGYYTESDVWPGPGPRGAERLVFGANGEVYYSNYHYDPGSFVQIR
jgi:hypothetical protein